MIQATGSFKDNLRLLPSIDGIARLDLTDPTGTVVASIANEPGKQGSLAVYQYLHLTFGLLDAEAATHGIAVFAEHTEDARARPDAHPNIDRLFEIIDGAAPLSLHLVKA